MMLYQIEINKIKRSFIQNIAELIIIHESKKSLLSAT